MNCLFCDFVSRKRKQHVDGLPFIPVNKTKHTLSFLSIDFPVRENAHLLIIPKNHFAYIEDIPKPVLNDLISHTALAAKIIKKSYGGCNVWVNNGKSAGQYIPHIHVHLISRDRSDKIKIMRWKRKNISEKQFKDLSLFLQEQFQQQKKIN